MNITLIDNGSSFTPKLLGHLRNYGDVEEIEVADLDLGHDFGDIIVLSGSGEKSVLRNLEFYAAEIQLVQSCPRPIVGVCLGFQLICYAYGGSIIRLSAERSGPMNIDITDQDFLGRDTLRVYQAHHWAVQSVPSSLRVLASSSDGLEAIAHRTKKIYGTQFHPESAHSQSQGYIALDYMLRRTAQRRVIA